MKAEFFEQVEPVAKAGFWVITVITLSCKVLIGEFFDIREVLEKRKRRRGGK